MRVTVGGHGSGYAPNTRCLKGLVLAMALLSGAGLQAAEPEAPPVRVCDILHDLASYDGKVVAVIGRFSSRAGGRFMSEQGCAVVKNGEHSDATAIQIFYDAKTAPRPPHGLSFDRDLIYKELESVKRQTSLANFRFGSQDYDRWAVVYGRIEVNKDTPSAALVKPAEKEFEPAPARLICTSNTMVVFLAN